MNDILLFDFNHKSSVLLIFFFNAIVFSILLLIIGIREGKAYSKWFALFLFLGGLFLCPFMLGYAGWYSSEGHRNFMFFFPFQQLFLIGPVFFFSVRSLVSRERSFTKMDFLHFIPAIAYFIYTLVVFIADIFVLDEFYFYADGQDKDLDFWYQMAGLISMLSYLVLSLRTYSNFRKASLQEVSFADEIAFKWVRRFAIAFALVLIVRSYFFILNPDWYDFGTKYWYYVCFAILLFYISIAGYTTIVKTTIHFELGLLKNDQPALPNSEEDIQQADSKTLETDLWKNKIIALFEDQNLYENPGLTLTDLAEQLNTNRNVISKAINYEFKMNFNDFVNKKRTEAVIHKLKNSEHISTTLLGIALDCGFNSKATFNRAFKKHTGITPQQFIQKNEL